MSSINILILEDHSLTSQMLVLALQGLGYSNLHCAENGEQALAILKKQKHFDVLICDIQTPGIDGLSFLRVATETGRIDALIISSVIAADLRLAIQQLARLSGYQVLGDLAKPFCSEALKMLLLSYCPRGQRKAQMLVEDIPSASEIQQGLADGEFIPFYQPKLNLQTYEVVGAEILVRWQHPQNGLLSPALFLESVQHFGFLNDMTLRIARQALGFLREQGLVGKISLSLNLEAEQLGLPGLPEAVRQMLDEMRIPARSLILELTETGLLKAPLTSIENLVRLRLLGCGVSIDDFGAGYSSLQRICEMPCSELKLDASFTRSLIHNPRSLAAVDSLLRLADNLGIQMVAEGIETLDQLELLQRMNCPIGQGYFFSRPLAGADFATWLQLRQPTQPTKEA
jgi:EAL domain-containing protein (putative c-di-GMP-specific phosphodiesterase class I)